MLIPLSRKKFEELIPFTATGDQFRHYWGKPPDVLRRVLLSLAALAGVGVLRFFLGEGFDLILFLVGLAAGCYWLWAPLYWSSRRNGDYRRFDYSGFWRGEVVDKYITEELIGTEETVNQRGELVIIENRERRLNLEVGDETGFTAKLQVPLRRDHRAIRRGDWAEMIVVSNRPDLSRITRVSDIYLPDYGLWVSDYPYVRRDSFLDVSRQLRRRSMEPEEDYRGDRYDRYADEAY